MQAILLVLNTFKRCESLKPQKVQSFCLERTREEKPTQLHEERKKQRNEQQQKLSVFYFCNFYTLQVLTK